MMHWHHQVSLTPYIVLGATPSGREEGSGHAATIELLLRQNVAVTNQICALCRWDLLSLSGKYVTCV